VAPSTLRLDEVTPRRLLSLAPIECRIEVLPEGADQWRKFQLNRDTATIAASLLLSCGRTFPSAAGFQTSEVFFTDDSGSYLFESRDTAVPVERDGDLAVELLRLLAAHKKQIRKLSDKTGAFPASRNSVTSSTSTIPIRCRSSTSILLPSFRRSWRSVPSPDNSSFKRSASADGSITGLIG